MRHIHIPCMCRGHWRVVCATCIGRQSCGFVDFFFVFVFVFSVSQSHLKWIVFIVLLVSTTFFAIGFVVVLRVFVHIASVSMMCVSFLGARLQSGSPRTVFGCDDSQRCGHYSSAGRLRRDPPMMVDPPESGCLGVSEVCFGQRTLTPFSLILSEFGSGRCGPFSLGPVFSERGAVKNRYHLLPTNKIDCAVMLCAHVANMEHVACDVGFGATCSTHERLVDQGCCLPDEC